MSPVVPLQGRRPGALRTAFVAGLSIALLVVASMPPSLRAADPTPMASQAPSTPAPQPAPSGALVPPDQSITAATTGGDGLLGRYYPNTVWSGTPSLERVDPMIDFDWSGAHPINAADFSVAWSGSLLAEVAGTYTRGTGRR